MDTQAHIDELEQQGRALAAAAALAGTDTAVPWCPGWTVLDLLTHTAGVHEWAATHVRADPDAQQRVELRAARPGEDVVARYRTAHAELVAALRAAPADREAWTFLPAPSPVAFWARRQAHECAIHRADAEHAAGAAVTFDRELAVDGIDELLLAFFATRRSRRIRSETPQRLLVAPVDTPRRWLVTIGPDHCHTEAVAAGTDAERSLSERASDTDCTISGSASELYLTLWNRADPPKIDGDPAALNAWRAGAHVRWS